jgi:asparagine synthase (glutamine-hydrolysing)
MCGIAGFIVRKNVDFDLGSTVQEMANSLSHRGPDDSGFVVFPSDGYNNKNRVAFGHRRLKIIDLSQKAHQPMYNPAKTIFISYNGEIYNYIELKDELVKKGYNFTSTSDTEVIIKSYEEWGVDCFKRFNGMWALAIFDKTKGKVILSRDRFGKKPLHYYRTASEFIFGSEIKALLKYPTVKKMPNYEKIFRYIAGGYRYVDIDDTSFFENIDQVPKSSYFEIDQSLNIKKAKYWQLDPNCSQQAISDKDAIDRFKDIFTDSVRLRLRSDVPVGYMLSGGLDSTAVACVAAKVLKRPIATFSGITGQEKGIYDESEFIDSVVRETGASSHYIRPDPADIFDVVNEMIGYHDEPICTVTCHSFFLILKKIAEHGLSVVLNGHGADELLAGYWDHYHYNFHDLREFGDSDGLNYEIEMWKKNHRRDQSEIKRVSDYISAMKENRALEVSRFADYSYLLNGEMVKEHKKNRALSSLFSGELLRRLDIELMQDGLPTVLKPEDRNTMSHSIESRSPFLDYRLAEFCFSLPNRLKIRDGVGKWLLREAMKDILPEDVRTRKYKASFISPSAVWFRTTNKDQIYDLINSSSFKNRKIYNIEKVKTMFEEHIKEEKDHHMVLWKIINLELWFRRFFD